MLWHLFIHELLKLTKDSEGINKEVVFGHKVHENEWIYTRGCDGKVLCKLERNGRVSYLAKVTRTWICIYYKLNLHANR